MWRRGRLPNAWALFLLMKKIALLFAGQGAQIVGMGMDLAETYPAVAALFGRADEVLGRSISAIAFDGPDEELTKTIHCQPALYRSWAGLSAAP